MNINIANASYSNEVASPEVEIAGEASGSVFADMKSRHADLKAMLDSNKESLKLEAMRRIITMVAKGKDASDLFPAVVKNVAAKSLELKKLVYAYLTRYAEEQQDLALLSISTFQRALKDPNQLIRASALRVLSSIRVPMIVPIMMLAIKDSMRDMSPYVRKTAAHAIPKLYYLDNDQKEELIAVIDHLMADRTTLVVGSAAYAFEEVCPERFDLVHRHFRKLCQLVVDVDEWGQVIMLNMLTRYARTQFADPNAADEELAEDDDGSNFYSSGEESTEGSTDEKGSLEKKSPKPPPKPRLEMDPDLRNLLRCTKSLLQSRNAAVVLAVAQLYYHLAPKTEVGLIARALIRLLRNHREVQSIVLTNIATISAKRRVDLYLISKNMFEAFLKSFFVRSEDPTHIKLLKLEILTNLATQTNISIILREFQTYVATQDKEFAAATIDAIGRCASNIKEVTDVCLSGLVNLMSNRNETVVAQSVVVIKKLLQMQPSQHQDIIVSMARIMDKIQVPAARASIVWLIGEHAERVPKIAPDVLRKMAKSFTAEEEIVKLQILNLATKLVLTNPDQTHLLVHYVFTLARYDQSYDLRDRARFLKNLVMPQKPHNLQQFSRSVFLTPKPAPVIEGRFKARDNYQLGTLSHYLNQRCVGYHDLPDFPEDPPDPSVRNSEQFPTANSMEVKPAPMSTGVSQQTIASGTASSLKKFYSEEEGTTSDDDENSSSESGSGAESDVSADSGDEESTSEEESGSESESGSSSGGSQESEEDLKKIEKPVPAKKEEKKEPVILTRPTKLEKEKRNKKSPREDKSKPDSTDLLLDFDFDGPSHSTAPATGAPILAPKVGAPALVPTAAGMGGPVNAGAAKRADEPLQSTGPLYIPTRATELVDKLTGQGLSLSYRFARSPNLFSGRSVTVELQFRNLTSTNKSIEGLKIVDKKLPPGMDMGSFPELALLGPGQSHCTLLGIDYGDTSQPATFTLQAGDSRFPISLTAPVGEQLEPVRMDRDRFRTEQGRLSGMNETSGSFKFAAGLSMTESEALAQKIYQVANVAPVEGAPENKLYFVGQTMSGKVPVLVSLERKQDSADVRLNVNCEKMVIGSMLYKELKKALS